MRICNNIANVIRAYKELSRKSYADCAKELGISCSALKDYAAGRRSPRMDTLEHLSKKLGVDPSLLISDSFTINQLMVMNKLLELLGYVQKIPPEYQEEFCSLCVRIIQILSLSVDNA